MLEPCLERHIHLQLMGWNSEAGMVTLAPMLLVRNTTLTSHSGLPLESSPSKRYLLVTVLTALLFALPTPLSYQPSHQTHIFDSSTFELLHPQNTTSLLLSPSTPLLRTLPSRQRQQGRLHPQRS